MSSLSPDFPLWCRHSQSSVIALYPLCFYNLFICFPGEFPASAHPPPPQAHPDRSELSGFISDAPFDLCCTPDTPHHPPKKRNSTNLCYLQIFLPSSPQTKARLSAISLPLWVGHAQRTSACTTCFNQEPVCFSPRDMAAIVAVDGRPCVDRGVVLMSHFQR